MSLFAKRPKLRDFLRLGQDVLALAQAPFLRADLSIFHKFEPPPTDGGHQFLHAFWRQAEAK